MINLCGIKLNNPIMPASGTMSYTDIYSPYLDHSKLGAIVTKAVTLNPREGNPPPRLVEVENGIINSVGLQNKGVDYFLEYELPKLKQYKIPIIVNVAGASVEDYVCTVQKLNKVGGVSGIELNISCPNVKEGCLAFGSDPSMTKHVVSLVREALDIPLIVKLTPNVDDIVSIALAAVEGGADSLSLINTVKAEAKGLSGGLSGPVIKPIALKLLKQVAKVTHVPLIGLGGISSHEDVEEFLKAGAIAVQVGTAALINPWVLEDLASLW